MLNFSDELESNSTDVVNTSAIVTDIEMLGPSETTTEKLESSDDIEDLPIDMRFNDGHVVAIVGFSILMVLSSIGNFTVLHNIFRSRAKSQINLMLSHLAVADLLVTFLMMPMEIGWAVTVSWKGGDILCRLMSFFRAFGLYLSGFVVMCISIDRYCAVLYPLQPSGVSQRRGKYLLTIAWISSFVCSLPQAYIFSVLEHPKHKGYVQCLTYNALTSKIQQISYGIIGVVFMYILPLITIIYCYSVIILEICRRVVDMGEIRMRRSNSGYLCRAKIRTLKMTITIVAVFLLCWTPYHVMVIWYFVDWNGALSVDPRVQRLLFLFACTNSSFNPLVYGIFNIRRRQQTTVNGINSRCAVVNPLNNEPQHRDRSNSNRIETKLPFQYRRPTM